MHPAKDSPSQDLDIDLHTIYGIMGVESERWKQAHEHSVHEPEPSPTIMKKLIQKLRVLVNLWSIRQQMRASELLLDSIDTEITSVNAQLELFKEFVDYSITAEKIRALREDRRTHAETIELYRHRMRLLWKMLRA